MAQLAHVQRPGRAVHANARARITAQAHAPRIRQRILGLACGAAQLHLALVWRSGCQTPAAARAYAGHGAHTKNTARIFGRTRVRRKMSAQDRRKLALQRTRALAGQRWRRAGMPWRTDAGADALRERVDRAGASPGAARAPGPALAPAQARSGIYLCFIAPALAPAPALFAASGAATCSARVRHCAPALAPVAQQARVILLILNILLYLFSNSSLLQRLETHVLSCTAPCRAALCGVLPCCAVP